MVRASINVALGRIFRRSDPLGLIYGWTPLGNLLSSVTRVPCMYMYLEELYMYIHIEGYREAKTP